MPTLKADQITRLPRNLGGESSTPRHGSGHKLTLAEILEHLVEDGLLAEQEAARLKAGVGGKEKQAEVHPLVFIAQQKPNNLKMPGKPLGLEVLTMWLAQRTGLEYERIDPLNVDVAAVTEV